MFQTTKPPTSYHILSIFLGNEFDTFTTCCQSDSAFDSTLSSAVAASRVASAYMARSKDIQSFQEEDAGDNILSAQHLRCTCVKAWLPLKFNVFI